MKLYDTVYCMHTFGKLQEKLLELVEKTFCTPRHEGSMYCIMGGSHPPTSCSFLMAIWSSIDHATYSHVHVYTCILYELCYIQCKVTVVSII